MIDAQDATVGYVDMGKATLRDAGDSHFATLFATGEIRDTMETLVARVEGFSFQHIRQLAAYIFFFDQALIKPNLPSRVVLHATPSASITAPPPPRGVIDSSPLDGTGLAEDSLAKEEERLLKHLKLGNAPAVKPQPAAPKPAAAPAPTHATSSVASSSWKPTLHTDIAPTDDRGLQTDAARREEDRIAKMFSGMSSASPSPAATNSTVSSAGSATRSAHPVPTAPSTDTAFELELWKEINSVRSDPHAYASHLSDMLPRFQGSKYIIPGTNSARETQEGVTAVQHAIAYLRQLKPLSEVSLSAGLSQSCRDLVAKASQTSNLASVETETESDARLSKYGHFVGKLFQNVALGNLPPRDMVISWIVDDGNPSRQQRECLFDAANSVIGISSGPHMKFGRITVLASAGAFQQGSSEGQQPSLRDPNAPDVEKETEIQVGPLEERKDGYFIDITNLGCPAKALTLRLEKQGVQLVIRRKVTVSGQVREFAQRLALPFPVLATQIVASYSVGAGKLALQVKKSLGDPAAGSHSSGEVGRFRVPADPSKSNDKVSVQPTQSSDFFSFSCESSKYDTDVVVSIDGRKLTFAAQYSFDTAIDGEEVVKTVKSNSAFSLPFDVTIPQIELTPVPGKGALVKVFKVASNTSASASSLADCDIPFLTKS